MQVESVPSALSVAIPRADYEPFIYFKAYSQSLVEHIGNPIICLFQSSLRPWIIDLIASDHLWGNKNLLTSLPYSNKSPPITLADGTKTQSD